MILAKPAALAAALLLPLPLAAHDLPVLAHQNGILIEDGYVRATGANAPTAAAYMRITNETDADDRLVEVGSDAAERVEVHATEMQDGIARMRPLDGIAVPARGSVVLESRGTHIMLMGLAAPMQPGGSIGLTLVFERAGAIPVTLPVDLGRTPGPGGGHEMPGMDH
jgi:copper(I)-binding protein